MLTKRIFLGYSEGEVRRIENNYYTMQFGGDFFIQDSCYLFTRSEVIRIYNKTLKDLIGIIEDGNEKDKKYALDLISKLIIQPMRFH
jgi:hypothetical protein